MGTVLIIWFIVGAVVSLMFFKNNDSLHQKRPDLFQSTQSIIEDNAESSTSTPEGALAVKIIVGFVMAVGGAIVWPLLAYLLIKTWACT